MTLQRFIAGAAAGIQPPTPLREPVILWDTRNWDGTTGVGTGGIQNEGTGGAAFDLDVLVTADSGGLLTYRAGQGGPPASWVNSPPIDWDDLGGEDCDAPWTMMTAYGSMPYLPALPGDGSGYTQFALRQAAFHPFGDEHLSFLHSWSIGFADEYSGFSQMSVGADYGGIDQPLGLYGESTSGNPDTGDMIREKLLVMTLDPIDGGASFWRGGAHPVAPQFYSAVDGYGPVPGSWINDESFIQFNTKGGCDLGGSGLPIDTNYRFCVMGDHRSFAPPQAEKAWNGVIGAAIFRGEPTAADLAYWEDYFYNDYVPWVNPLAYSGGSSIRVDSTYVYHTFRTADDLVPIDVSNLPSTVDLFMVGGGGGSFQGTPGGGGEAILVTGITAPVTSQPYVPGRGSSHAVSALTGIDTTFLGQTARFGIRAGFGGVGTAGASGNGNAGATGVINAAGGGGGSGGAGNAPTGGPTSGPGGVGTANDWSTGSTQYYGSGGTGGANTGAGASLGAPPLGGSPGNSATIIATGRGLSGIWGSSALPQGIRGEAVLRYLRVD